MKIIRVSLPQRNQREGRRPSHESTIKFALSANKISTRKEETGVAGTGHPTDNTYSNTLRKMAMVKCDDELLKVI